MAIVMPNTAFISLYQPTNQTRIQLRAKPGTIQARVITLQKTVKYCTYCKQDYYTENECHDKYPHLKEVQPSSNKLVSKRRRNGKPVKDNSASPNSSEGSYFIQTELGSFMAISAN